MPRDELILDSGVCVVERSLGLDLCLIFSYVWGISVEFGLGFAGLGYLVEIWVRV